MTYALVIFETDESRRPIQADRDAADRDQQVQQVVGRVDRDDRAGGMAQRSYRGRQRRPPPGLAPLAHPPPKQPGGGLETRRGAGSCVRDARPKGREPGGGRPSRSRRWCRSTASNRIPTGARRSWKRRYRFLLRAQPGPFRGHAHIP